MNWGGGLWEVAVVIILAIAWKDQMGSTYKPG
jgi:hypothetical protein